MKKVPESKPVLDPREVEKATKRMEWLIGFMIVRYHFVYQILSMTTKKAVVGMGTMGVRVLGGGNFELVFDPVFVNRLKDEHLTYVLYHEVLHLALHHCTSRRFDLHALGNIATDLAVNELIPENAKSCERPEEGQFVSEYKKMPEYKDILEKQNAEWYYDYLRKKMKDQCANCDGTKCKVGKDFGKNPGNTVCGKNKFDEHGGWKEDEVADEKVRAKIDEVAKGNLWGDVGASEKELILAAQTRKINWRNILRQFYGNHIWHDRESTRKRPNRRTGLIHPGARKLQVDRHLVAVDTSGSIDSELLSQFLATINQMTDYVPIDMMQCDCVITSAPVPFNRKLAKFAFSGRGGTSFQPVMDLVNERRYKSVVILTDGCADECTKPKAQVVWVLPPGNNPPVDWGLRINMNRY